ncbi:DNA-binding protein [Halobacteria archaeon AArc-m2/3/4]|uniref:DNA-binding protein n=2 Tax=Natronoglomus mannanivorans TaxID=2979990 RepID=A0ABT2QGH2_9EURY|nr:DNA-binding protein [Halobacteria archaeon AArc-m2/3/4]
MSSTNSVSKVVSVDEQAYENEETREGNVVDESPEFRATVEMEIQAKVDANHPDARIDEQSDQIYGKTLEQEERIRAREEELEMISARAAFGRQSGRERRSQRIAEEAVQERHREFQKRAASVDSTLNPDRQDPREQLSPAELGQVNEQAGRLAAETVGGYTRAVIARRIATCVLEGAEIFEAVMAMKEELHHEAGTIVPIGSLEEIDRGEISIEGEIVELWEPSCRSMQQVGLIEDETGMTKFTVWKASRQPMVREGERVRFRAVAKNWYQGRCSIALTGWSQVVFPDRGRWWA